MKSEDVDNKIKEFSKEVSSIADDYGFQHQRHSTDLYVEGKSDR